MSVRSMYRYANGDGTDYELAEKWMKLAAEKGSAEDQYQLGVFYTMEFDKNGQQVKTNFPAAGEWYRKAAEQGHVKAQYELAEMYYYGQLGGDCISNAAAWFLKAAAQGNAAAQTKLSQMKIEHPNNDSLKMVDAVDMLRQGAENGSLDSQLDLAKRYQTGNGVAKDPVEAFQWMQKAAQNDQPTYNTSVAMYDLALMYENGEGVTQDLSEAHKLFLEASSPDFRNSDASFRAGQLYEKGDGVQQDDQKAAELYENVYLYYYKDYGYTNDGCYLHIDGPTQQSIESLYRLWAGGRGFPSPDIQKLPGYGDPNICIRKYWGQFLTTAKTEFYVGEIFYQGKLVTQDLVEADVRFRIAAGHGLDDARKMLKEIEPKMSPAQIKVAIETAINRIDSLEKRYDTASRNNEEKRKADEPFEKLKHDVSQ